MAEVAAMLPVGWPARRIEELARSASDAGIREVWVAEDLGLHGGVALSAHLLATVPQVRVGLVIAPAAARHPAFLAMQAATLGQLHPGRFLLGIGHGMPGWMRQLGLWPAAPVPRLTTTLTVVRSLLQGQRVTLEQHGVLVDEVGLATAPVDVPLYAGVRGPRSLGAVAPLVDGVVLAGWSGPAYIRWARELVTQAAGAPRRIVASARVAYDDTDPERAHHRLASQFQRDTRDGTLDVQLDAAGRAHAHHRPGDPHDPGEAHREGEPHRPTAQDLPLAEIGVAGGPGEVADAITRWAAAGADVVLLDPLTPDDLERLLAAGRAAAAAMPEAG